MSRTRITDKYEIAVDHSLGECMGYDSGCWLYEIDLNGNPLSQSIPLILDSNSITAFWGVVSWDDMCNGNGTNTAKRYSVEAVNQLSEDVKQKIVDALTVDLVRRRMLTTNDGK